MWWIALACGREGDQLLLDHAVHGAQVAVETGRFNARNGQPSHGRGGVGCIRRDTGAGKRAVKSRHRSMGQDFGRELEAEQSFGRLGKRCLLTRWVVRALVWPEAVALKEWCASGDCELLRQLLSRG